MTPTATDPARALRTDGERSRERLVRAGLALFAQHGYAKTSTREIAEAAQTNIAAISYYFGDKAGLYRAVFFEPQGPSAERDIARYAGAELTLEQALQGLYASFLEPLRHGDMARQCMKLHAREMIEPTGLWQEEIDTGIRPMHEALVAVLCRHFGMAHPDDDVQRLAVCIAGLGVHMHVGRDVTDTIVPSLNADPRALDLWMERLVMYARAMVAAEAARRQQHPPQPAPQGPTAA
jgi:TetR/AcrR family transcriptional regulator, regulator of cefoperazone and chloramphenicol sensitivity